MNVAAKWVGAIVAVPALAIAIYFGAVIQVYLLAWIIEVIGEIF